MPFTRIIRKIVLANESPLTITLGDHLRKARSERSLTQLALAVRLDVSEATVVHRENGATEPPIMLWPRIIAFLGYDPAPSDESLGGRMRAYRRRSGQSISEAARCTGVDPDSWAKWERSGVVSRARQRVAIEAILAAPLD